MSNCVHVISYLYVVFLFQFPRQLYVLYVWKDACGGNPEVDALSASELLYYINSPLIYVLSHVSVIKFSLVPCPPKITHKKKVI